MSWGEVKKINSDLSKPLDTLVTEKTTEIKSAMNGLIMPDRHVTQIMYTAQSTIPLTFTIPKGSWLLNLYIIFRAWGRSNGDGWRSFRINYTRGDSQKYFILKYNMYYGAQYTYYANAILGILGPNYFGKIIKSNVTSSPAPWALSYSGYYYSNDTDCYVYEMTCPVSINNGKTMEMSANSSGYPTNPRRHCDYIYQPLFLTAPLTYSINGESNYNLNQEGFNIDAICEYIAP